jgi:hypothetical protein
LPFLPLREPPAAQTVGNANPIRASSFGKPASFNDRSGRPRITARRKLRFGCLTVSRLLSAVHATEATIPGSWRKLTYQGE